MKNRDDVKIIDSKAIMTLSQKVTQQINPKYLTQFIKTTISNNDITTNKNSFYYSTFIESSLSYEILIFQTGNINNTILEPFLFISYYNTNNNQKSVDVFILEDRFILFENQKFLILKNVENVSVKDIEIYVNQTYNIKIDNFININKEKLVDIKNKYLNNNYQTSNIKFNSIIEDKSYIVFKLFFLLSTLIFIFTIFLKIYPLNQTIQENITSSKTTLVQNNYIKLEDIYKKNTTKVMDRTIELFKYLKVNRITLETFEYKNNKIIIKLVDKEKKRLLDFITIYTEDISVNSIEFDKENTTFKMDIIIKI